MDDSRTPADGPPVADIESVFHVVDVRTRGDAIYYLGTPLSSAARLERELWPLFHDAGYEVSLSTRAQVDATLERSRTAPDDEGDEPESTSADPVGTDSDHADSDHADSDHADSDHAESPAGTANGGLEPVDRVPDPGDDEPGGFDTAEARFGPVEPQYVLVAEERTPHIDGVPWTNVLFFAATVLSTLLVGAGWYYIPYSAIVEDPLRLLNAWPFAAAILGPLAVHEMGHYVMIRYYDVDASLPYFIPFPSLIGTMGAVIRMQGRIPSRKALFDIGVAGPLAGLVATVVVTIIGLYSDPITVPQSVLDSPSTTSFRFNYPMLLQGLGTLTGQPLGYEDPTLTANPIIFGGWVGMFVTFLNLLPVGQFDGGHITRAALGPRQETVAAGVPVALFALAGYLYYFDDVTNAVVLWGFWGVLAIGLAYAGPATPIRDEPIDAKRKAVAVLTFVLGLLCFTPVPFEILSG